MNRYTILMPDTEHLEEICQDIRYQTEIGAADLALFVIKLVPEGDPVIDKAAIQCEKYDLFRDRLREMGLDCGILAQCTIGHGYPLNQMFPFQPYIGLKDGKADYVSCPYDPGFQDYIRDQMKTLARHEPKMIMVDDDFRLLFRGGGGCVCPKHLKEISTRLGEEITRKTLVGKLQAEDHPDGRYTQAFVETQRESLLLAAQAMREGIDRVDPHLPGSFCCVGPNAEFAAEIAKALAGEGNPVIVRINNGNYHPASGMHYFSYNASQRAAMQIGILRDRVDVILAETDTCPQNRYSTGASFLHSHFTASLLEGAAGAKHWITRLMEYEPESGIAYRKKLGEYDGFYRKLCDYVPTLRWRGCRIPVYREPYYCWSTFGGFGDGNTWGMKALERLGLPMYFSAETGGVTFLENDEDHRWRDEDVLAVLSGNCVISSPAAKRLTDRGFGEYLGVSVQTWNGQPMSFERIAASGKKCTVQKNSLEIAVNDPDVRVDSTVYHLHDGKDEIPLFPGVTTYRNRLGGTVTVFAGTSDTEYNYTQAFSLLCHSRKQQLISLLREMGELPVYYPGDAEIYFRAAEMPDGRLFCVLFNLGMDRLDEVPLVAERKVAQVTTLCPDGSERDCKFRDENETLLIETASEPAQPLVLLLK